MVEGATPGFLALVRHRAGGRGAHQNSQFPSPVWVAPYTVPPWREGCRVCQEGDREKQKNTNGQDSGRERQAWVMHTTR